MFGFSFALENARAQIAGGTVDNALVIMREDEHFFRLGRSFNFILFGDGAGAAVLKADGEGRGLMPAVTGSDGRLAVYCGHPEEAVGTRCHTR